MAAMLRVLYAEDSEIDADLTRAHFAEQAPDIALEIVRTGQACLDRAAAVSPDLLLVDHHLPDMDGLDVLRSVIRSGSPVPVVLVTGVGDEELVVSAMRLGASDYVPKVGAYLESLPDLVRTVIERARLGLTDAPNRGERHRLLYVEHDAADVDLTSQHFEEAAPAFDLEVSRSTEDALARLASPPVFDAMLLDLRMPGRSGLELVKEAVRRRLPLPPFVVITGKGDEAAALASLKLGAIDYVQKRAGYLDQLVRAIERAVDQGRLARLNEQLKLELAERQRVEAELREANRRKDEYLGALSHELRNPLMPIHNSLYILERAKPGSEQAQRAERVLSRQVGHLTRLVDELLEVTRIARGKIQLRLERINLSELISQTVEDHRTTFDEKGIGLTTLLPGAPLYIVGDATRLAQLVDNVLQNAFKFTSGGGAVTVELSEAPGREALISVRDTGAGIPPEAIARLFEPFVQAEHTLDRSSGGLGLGLAMVKGLVELHGGQVQAHSEGPGRGAQFTLRFPLAPCEPDSAAIRAEPTASALRLLGSDATAR